MYELWLYWMDPQDESEDQPESRVGQFPSYEAAKSYGDVNPPAIPGHYTYEILSPDGRLMSRLAWRWE